jgi:hypothetical protein
MTTQWHPIFANLLRPLVEGHYDVQTDLPVGDVPRAADIVLLRRTSAAAPPFTGLWRWLTPWNVLEFKGPTVSARVDDLDNLVELGLGIHRRLNEERHKQHQPRVGRQAVSFWYLANHLGRRFLRSAHELLGPLESLAPGVWRVPLLHRSLVLVSGQDVAVERESLPVHLLAVESEEQLRTVAQVLGQNVDLLPAYGFWLAGAHPALAREVAQMGRTKSKKFALNFAPIIKEVGWREIIDQVGVKSLIDEVGLKPMIKEVGLDQLVAQLTPEEQQELQRLLQQRISPPGN